MCMMVRVVKKDSWSTVSPISEATACFADASPFPISLRYCWFCPALFQKKAKAELFCVGCVLQTWNWRELDRLYGDARFNVAMQGGRSQLDAEG